MYLWSSTLEEKKKTPNISLMQNYFEEARNMTSKLVPNMFCHIKLSVLTLLEPQYQVGYVVDKLPLTEFLALGQNKDLKLAIYEPLSKNIRIIVTDSRLYRPITESEMSKIHQDLMDFSKDKPLPLDLNITSSSFCRFRKNYLPLIPKPNSTHNRMIEWNPLSPFLILNKNPDNSFTVLIDDGENHIQEHKFHSYELTLAI